VDDRPLAHLFQPSGGVPPDLLIPGERRRQSPLLQVKIGTALDRQEDQAAQQGVDQQHAAYREVYDAALEERVLAGLVWHSAEAEAPDLPRRVRLGALRRRSLERRRVTVVGRLEALISSIMPDVVLLHPLCVFPSAESPAGPAAFVAGRVAECAHLRRLRRGIS